MDYSSANQNRYDQSASRSFSVMNSRKHKWREMGKRVRAVEVRGGRNAGRLKRGNKGRLLSEGKQGEVYKGVRD